MMRLSLCIIALILAAMAHSSDPPEQGLSYKEGQFLVKILDGASANDVYSIASSINAELLETFTIVPGLYLYRFDEQSMALDDVLKAFRDNPSIEYVEPDYYYQAAAIPNDTLFGQLWALENTGQSMGTVDADINASTMWNIQTGSSSVVIGVLDSGVDYNHNDLKPNLWKNLSEIAANGIDDDGNGYIDDVYGINAISNNGNPIDTTSHGTHISGTIGAKGNNAMGVVGVNQTVGIATCKFLDNTNNGTTSDAIQCLQYFQALKTRSVNAVNIVATNNSWGGGAFSQALSDAIVAHQNLGILFVAAAGNATANNDLQPFYPASYQLANVISVAATDQTDQLASFSNYGRRTVHVSAPGNKIFSTVINQSYAFFSGTSMAVPHVAGLVGIIKAQFPSMDYRNVKNLVISSGKPLASLQSTTITGRRIRGADTNGQGALTCSNQNVVSRLTPTASNLTLSVGGQVLLSAINIRCSLPNGSVTVYSDANQTVTLLDGGINGDVTSGDGTYSLLWKPQIPGTYALNFGGGDIVTVTVNAAPPAQSYVAYTPAYSYETITGTSLNVGDDSITAVTVPFAIHFNGDVTGFQTIYVNSNGTISTSSADPGYSNLTLPTGIISTLIAPYWDDLLPTTGTSNVFVATTGTAPNRHFVVEWRNMKNYGATGTGTFQVIFYENSPDILMNYSDTVFGSISYDAGASATIGVQTSVSVATLYSFNSISVTSPKSVLFHFEQATKKSACFLKAGGFFFY